MRDPTTDPPLDAAAPIYGRARMAIVGGADRTILLDADGGIDIVPIATATLTAEPARLLGVDAILWIDDGGAETARSLAEIAADAAALCVALAPDRIDDWGWAVGRRGIDLFVNDRAAAVSAAVQRALRRESAALRDVDPVRRLSELSDEVARIAAAIGELAAVPREAPRVADRSLAFRSEPARNASVDAASVRRMIRALRQRDGFFPGLFADPAWDILLDLFAARLEGRQVAVSSLCIAAAVPPTTALRWIGGLTEHGLLERRPDPQDGRRVHIALADEAAARVEACIAAVLSGGLMVA